MRRCVSRQPCPRAQRIQREFTISDPAPASPYTMMTVHNGGRVTEFGSLGEGPAVVQLPGRGGEGPDQFDVLGPALAAAGFRAVAVNLRGIGNSTGRLEQLSLHDLAHDVAAVIRAVGTPAHLVGRAFGNRLARCTAVDFPTTVKSVALIAAGGLVPPDPARAPVKPKTARRRLRYWRVAGSAQEHAAQNTPVEQWWSGGSTPMLVVQGLADRIAVPENGRQLARDYPDRVRLREIPGAGHMLLFDHPDDVVPEVVAFVGEVEAGRFDPAG